MAELKMGDKRSPLVYYAENPTYLDWGTMSIYRHGEEPYYKVSIENRYGSGDLKLTEKDISRLLSCLKEEFKNPPIVVQPFPFEYDEDEEYYEMQGGDNLF